VTTVLVTGGLGDIGRGVAASFVADGAEVHLADLAPDTVDRAAGLGATGHLVDVTRPADVAALAGLGPLDVVVHGVGSWPLLSFDDLTPEVFAEQVAVNLTAAYTVLWTLREPLRAARGSAVLLSSAVALKGHPQMIQYAAAKAGVLGMMRSLALSLGPDGVRVNAVAPGLVTTERNAELWGAERRAAFRAQRALGQDLFVDDVVAAVRYLASAGARAVTGQTLVVDGGTVLH
jgi:NAD(P)-dependent dehydrogenase (short-subunit alcohol dehydrogenase family)